MDKVLTDFITEYRDYITLFTGIVLAVGAVKTGTGCVTRSASRTHTF